MLLNYVSLLSSELHVLIRMARCLRAIVNVNILGIVLKVRAHVPEWTHPPAGGPRRRPPVARGSLENHPRNL